jgi:hypothetical protein
MPGRAGRIGFPIAALLLAPVAMAWAGSSQAPLMVGAVVPARCAVTTPESVGVTDAAASLSRPTVAMRCTKGTLPVGGPSRARAVGPRISRDLILTAPAVAPRPLAETGPSGVTGSRLVVTVNF